MNWQIVDINVGLRFYLMYQNQMFSDTTFLSIFFSNSVVFDVENKNYIFATDERIKYQCL